MRCDQKVWSQLTSCRRPVPNWKVFVDVWVSLPYPEWYLDYLEIHSQEEEPPNLGEPSLLWHGIQSCCGQGEQIRRWALQQLL